MPQPDATVTIAIQGKYHPPGGVAGQITDAMAMHSLAEQSLVGLLDSPPSIFDKP